jgi:sugar lactone lactonase YvrE
MFLSLSCITKFRRLTCPECGLPYTVEQCVNNQEIIRVTRSWNSKTRPLPTQHLESKGQVGGDICELCSSVPATIFCQDCQFDSSLCEQCFEFRHRLPPESAHVSRPIFSSNNQAPCQACRKFAADFFCRDCPRRKSQCKDCHAFLHREPGPNQGHVCVPWSADCLPPVCNRHSQECLMFCKQDDVAVCTLCSYGEHKGHDICVISEESKACEQRILDAVRELEEAARGVQSVGQAVRDRYEGLLGRSLMDTGREGVEGGPINGGEVGAVTRSIREYFEMLRETLKRREDALIHEAEDIGRNQAIALTEQLSMIETYVVRCYSANFKARDKLKKKSRVWLLQNESRILKDLSEHILLEKEVPRDPISSGHMLFREGRGPEMFPSALVACASAGYVDRCERLNVSPITIAPDLKDSSKVIEKIFFESSTSSYSHGYAGDLNKDPTLLSEHTKSESFKMNPTLVITSGTQSVDNNMSSSAPLDKHEKRTRRRDKPSLDGEKLKAGDNAGALEEMREQPINMNTKINRVGLSPSVRLESQEICTPSKDGFIDPMPVTVSPIATHSSLEKGQSQSPSGSVTQIGSRHVELPVSSLVAPHTAQAVSIGVVEETAAMVGASALLEKHEKKSKRKERGENKRRDKNGVGDKDSISGKRVGDKTEIIEIANSTPGPLVNTEAPVKDAKRSSRRDKTTPTSMATGRLSANLVEAVSESCEISLVRVLGGIYGEGKGATKVQFNEPFFVSCSDDGFLFVTECVNHRVQIVSPIGLLVRSFGSEGSGNGQFHEPTGICCTSRGLLYVADADNHRVQVFTSGGEFVRAFGGPGSGKGQFNSPVGIASDRNGNIYVADYNNHRVQIFNDYGQYKRMIGGHGPGSNNGQFNNPECVCCSEDDALVYVTDRDNHRVQIFNSEGEFISAFGSEGSQNGQFNEPTGICCTRTGLILVTDPNNHRVQVFSRMGQFITAFGSEGSAKGQFSSPMGIACDSDGQIYVADYSNSRIQVFQM